MEERTIRIEGSKRDIDNFYFEPSQYIQMVADGKEKGLLLYGESSLGKSYWVKKVLAESGKMEGKDYFIISGHITPLQFYCKLYLAKDKIVVFDDVNILESKINLNMLKAALNENSHGKVEYYTTRKLPEEVPESFIFEGKVIILLNEKPRSSEHMRAIENRVIVYELKFSYEEVLEIIEEIAVQDFEDVSYEERQEIVRWLRENTSRATRNLNIRLFQHLLRLCSWDKSLWKVLGHSFLEQDENLSLIIQGCSEKEFVEQTGHHRATYYRLKRKLSQSRSDKVNVTLELSHVPNNSEVPNESYCLNTNSDNLKGGST